MNILTVNDITGRTYTREDFVFFWGHTDRSNSDSTGKHCLSQWYMIPTVVDGICYNCMEQYLMAMKARTFGDTESEAMIMGQYNQMEIKKLGRKVKGFDDSVWEKARIEISLRGNIHKFAQNHQLKSYLLSTGNRIIAEASPKDRIWGIGMGQQNKDIINPSLWDGQNILGFTLMEVRSRLRGIEEKLNSIIELKDDDDPWPREDYVKFCLNHSFTQMVQWKCNDNLFGSIGTAVAAAQQPTSAEKIMIDMRYGPGFPFLRIMFFEQLHNAIDRILEQHGTDFIFSLTPDPALDRQDSGVYLTLFRQ